MQNNIEFFNSDLTDVGTGSILPDNLANFRDVTMSDRDKREKRCKVIAIMLNYHLGWYLNQNDHRSALGSAENQHEIEKLNSIGPIKYTSTFRLSPGEAKRVADRLHYVPLVHRLNGRYYRNTLRIVKSNKDLIKPLSGAPSTIINKFKKRGSRSNYYTNNRICVNNDFWNTNEDILWELLLSNAVNVYYNHGLDRDYRMLNLRNLVEERYDNRDWTLNGENINSCIYSNQTFAADLFNYLKQCLTIRRNTPEIVYSDEEDYTALRQFLTIQTENIITANIVLKSMATITNARLFKTQGELLMTYKIILHKPGIHIKHPSGESHHDVYVRHVQDIYGNNADFTMGVQCQLSENSTGFRIRRCRMEGFTNINHFRPNLYNTSGENSNAARVIDRIFDNDNESLFLTNNNCFSEHERGIFRSANRLDYLTLCMNLLTWHQVYIPTRTQPYEHPNQVFFGIGNDIPEWYRSLHDSSSGRCRSLIITNYAENGGSTIDAVSNQNLRALALNHCNNCYHKDAEESCNTFATARVRAFGDNWDNYTIALAEHNKDLNTEVCTPTPTAVETIVEEVLEVELNEEQEQIVEVLSNNADMTTTVQETIETERERAMRLMAGWVQSER